MTKKSPVPMTEPTDTFVKQPTNESVRQSIEPSESIFIKAANGQKMELTDAKLDQWFAHTEQPNREENIDANDYLATQLLTRYGFQSSKDVIRFLKTPAGEAVVAMMNEKLAEIAALDDARFQQMREAQSKHHSILAFFLLGLLYRQDAKAKQFNEFIQQQIDGKLQYNEKIAQEPHKTSEKDAFDHYKKELASYDASAKSLQSNLDYKHSELELLAKEILSITQHQEAIKDRYSAFDEHLTALDGIIDEVHNQDDTAHTNDAKIRHVTGKIIELEKKISDQELHISQLLEQNKDVEAQKLLHQHNGLHIQIAGLKDMKSVLNEEKKLFTEEGEETSSFKDAAFILTPDLKVVKDGSGKHYLIGAKQNLDDMDETMKAKAATRFNKLKPEISTIKQVVEHNCKLENAFHRQRVQSAEKRGITKEGALNLQSEISLIRNQLNQVKAAQASVIAEMKKPRPDIKKVMGMQNSMPNVAGGTSVNRAPLYATQKAFMAALAARNFILNQQEIDRLSKMKDFPIGKIKAGVPIPAETMRFLERNVHNLSLQSEAYQHPTVAPKEPKPTAPTPFSTTPSPYKK